MDDYYQGGGNCAGGPNKVSCDNGYSCCSQKGNEKRYGMCIKNENGCNSTTGFAKKKASKKLPPINEKVDDGMMDWNEGYTKGDDGYDSDNDETSPSSRMCMCHHIFMTIFFIAILSILIICLNRRAEF